MLRPSSGRFAIGAAILAVLGTVGLSLRFAWTRSLSEEKQQVSEYAREVLRRSDEVGDQISRSGAVFRRSGFAPCSPQEIDLMRQLDLGSSYIQMMARQSGTNLICTSRGDLTPIPVGPEDVVTNYGSGARIGRHLSRFSNDPMILISSRNFVAVVDQMLIFDIPLEGADISLELLLPSAKGRPSVGFSGRKLAPLRFVKGGAATSYVDGDDVVAVARSSKYDVEAVARAPKAYALRRFREFVLEMLPIGLLGGGVLAWAVTYLAQIYFSQPNMLRAAAKHHEFYLEYQPIVELSSRRWIGAEAFVRWKRGGKSISPDQFIPIAEQSGVIGLITSEVMAMVAKDFPRLMAIDPEFQVSINLSGADVRSPETLEKLDRLICDGKAKASNIDVEVTERSFLHDLETRAGMVNIRDRGFTVSIDDFGTGYSNLASLQSLKIDALKIDKAFVDTIEADAATSGVVMHIIRMALALNLEVVAEGVETEAQAKFLEAEGVAYAQGWHFSKSLPIDVLCERMPAQGVGFEVLKRAKRTL